MSDFGDTRFPVGRKDYRCEWCGERINAGELHPQFVGQWEGEFQSWRMHSECLAWNSESIAEGFTPYENERPEVTS